MFVWFSPDDDLFFGGFHDDDVILCCYEECVHFNEISSSLVSKLVSAGFICFTLSIARFVCED